jgi:hypothetical protein
VLGNDKRILNQFHLLKACLDWVGGNKFMGSIDRTVLQSVINVVVDLFGGKVRTFMFGMTFLSADASFPASRFSFGFRGWLDNVA